MSGYCASENEELFQPINKTADECQEDREANLKFTEAVHICPAV